MKRMSTIEQIVMQATEQARSLELVANYRRFCADRGDRPKPVWGVYNQNMYLIYWSLSKRHSERYADKLRWDDAPITVKRVPV